MGFRSRLKALLPFAIVNRRLVDNLRCENRKLLAMYAEADKRWVDLNALMAHRAQQERGAVVVRQRGQRLTILAVKTSPAGVWEITVE